MKAKVYFSSIPAIESAGGMPNAISELMAAAGFQEKCQQRDLIAVKLHFGEKGNQPPIPPQWIKPISDMIKSQGASPFLTDTCVLYRSQRDNAVKYLRLIQNFGFTMGKTGAPVMIADGLAGNDETEVEIEGQIFKRVAIASVAAQASGLMVLSHVTGHMAAGMGAAIKNLGMGFASRKGKLRQHAAMKPHINKALCTGCRVCTQWCPVNAIHMDGDVAEIDSHKCIGCGECVTVCRYYAVKHDWRTESSDLQKRMAEHALGVIIQKKDKVGFLNFLTSITKDCDCIHKKQTPIMPDIGILASDDPVAIDSAGLDLIHQNAGATLNEMAYPIDPYVQIQHGEAIGLGTRQYDLIEV